LKKFLTIKVPKIKAAASYFLVFSGTSPMFLTHKSIPFKYQVIILGEQRQRFWINHSSKIIFLILF